MNHIRRPVLLAALIGLVAGGPGSVVAEADDHLIVDLTYYAHSSGAIDASSNLTDTWLDGGDAEQQSFGRLLTSGIVLAPTLLHASDGVPLKATIVTTSESFQPGTFPVLGFVTSTGEGTSTHLGKLTTSGQVALIWTSEGVWFVGAGTSVAANGDELYNTLEGLDTGYGDTSGTFTITGGTGRFAGATGSGTFTSSRDADDVMTAVHEGTIDYKKN